jgi:photosystem II stability/assembly factor-like uncharacterized protein
LPTPTIVEKTPILMPAVAQLSAPSSMVVWSLFAGFDFYRATDGGNMWERLPLPPVVGGGGVPEVSFVSAQEGWWSKGGVPGTQCTGAGIEMWHTTDGAANWSRSSTKGIGFDQCKEGLSFVDATHGFLGAWDPNHSPTIYRTSDGGGSWTGATLPDPPGFVTQGGVYLRAGLVKSYRGTLLVAASWGGETAEHVFRSTDGGASWTYVATITNRPGALALVTASRWLKIGNDSSAIETIDAGKTWHSFATDYSDAVTASSEPSGFVFVDELVGYGTFHGGVRRTVDGGSHWITLKTPWPSAPTTPSATASPAYCGAESANGWLTYSSTKWGYSMDYLANWCNLPNFGAPDTEKYFSNENAGSPLEMTSLGIYVRLSVAAGACPAAATRGFKEIYEQKVLKVAGQDVTRTYGFFSAGEAMVMVHAAAARGENCYTFNLITQTRRVGDKNLVIADRMISSLKFT